MFDGEALGKQLVVVVRDFVSRSLEQPQARIAALEQRLAALEAFEYTGTFEMGRTYTKGQFTTYDGSLWACNRPTTSRPGDGPSWTLAVKRGKDAR